MLLYVTSRNNIAFTFPTVLLFFLSYLANVLASNTRHDISAYPTSADNKSKQWLTPGWAAVITKVTKWHQMTDEEGRPNEVSRMAEYFSAMTGIENTTLR